VCEELLIRTGLCGFFRLKRILRKINEYSISERVILASRAIPSYLPVPIAISNKNELLRPGKLAQAVMLLTSL
jgi:hypothetical protein